MAELFSIAKFPDKQGKKGNFSTSELLRRHTFGNYHDATDGYITARKIETVAKLLNKRLTEASPYAKTYLGPQSAKSAKSAKSALWTKL